MPVKALTPEEKLNRFEDLREIKNLMGRMSADYLDCKQAGMFDAYWSKRDDVCLAVNSGYFTGSDSVAAYYANLADRVALESSLIKAHFPDDLAGKSDEEVFGVGHMDYKPVETGIIEIAGDRKTAKGLWCMRGAHAKFTPYGPWGMWEWGWFAADFVMEDGEWRIWHLQYIIDVLKKAGTDWTGPDPEGEVIPQFAALADFKEAEPDVPAILHENYNAGRAFSPSPRQPEPYETFSETFSYGMEA